MTHQPENRVARFGGGGGNGIRGNVLRPAFGSMAAFGDAIVFGGDVEPIDFEFRDRASDDPQQWWLTTEQLKVVTMAWTLRRSMIQPNFPEPRGLSYLAGCEDGNSGRVFSFSGWTHEYFVVVWRAVFVAQVQRFHPASNTWEVWATHILIGERIGRRLMAMPESRDPAGNPDRIWFHGGVQSNSLPNLDTAIRQMMVVSRTTRAVSQRSDSPRGVSEYMAGFRQNRKIFYFGGAFVKSHGLFDGEGVVGEYRSYDVLSDTWVNRGENALLHLYELAGGVVGGEVVIVGGEDLFPGGSSVENPNGRTTNRSIKYLSFGDAFVVMATTLTVPRRGAAGFVTGTVDDPKLHVVGGGPNATAGRTSETLNAITDVWVQSGVDMSVNRAHHGAAAS